MADSPTPWHQLQLQRVVVPPEVVFRSLAHETVLLNIRTGRYHGVDEIGARFFAAAREAPNLTGAADVLAAEYGQPIDRIREDLLAFLDDLQARGLVALESSLADLDV